MTKLSQIKKNVALTEKLASYIVNNPKVRGGFPSNATYVVFTTKDKELNSKNLELVTTLQKQGKKVVKAKSMAGSSNSWEFTPAF